MQSAVGDIRVPDAAVFLSHRATQKTGATQKTWRVSIAGRSLPTDCAATENSASVGGKNGRPGVDTCPTCFAAELCMEFTKLGPYRLGKKLGQGGMGAVYQGLDESSGQLAATSRRSASPSAARVG